LALHGAVESNPVQQSPVQHFICIFLRQPHIFRHQISETNPHLAFK
jgi:hypothetical protein